MSTKSTNSLNPIAKLEEQRRMIWGIEHSEHEEDEPEEEADCWRRRATELAECVKALDEYRINGGSDPYTNQQ